MGGNYGGGQAFLYAPSALTVDAWTHLAATFDGTTLRIFVNGTQVASEARSGVIATSTTNLKIGAGDGFEFFAGVLDEVRIYNVALTQAQIQADMNTPVGGATPGAGTIQFSAATYSVGENAGTATVTVTRTGGSSGAVSVTFATSNGTATAPGDYTAVSQTVSFANGDTASKTVDISISDDTTVEANETVNLALTSPTGGATLGSPSTAVLTITDNDVAPAGTIQFSAATYSVGENAGTATVTVTRTGGSSGAVSVTFATSNGTATAPGDYTAVSQTVSFANGDTASKTVNIPISDDTTVEANETVNLALTSPTGGATLGSPSTAVLTITDNDVAPAGTIQFSAATYSVGENAGTATVTVTRTGGSSGAVSVTFATSNGTATAPGDYTAVSQTVSFANGDTASKTVDISISDDTTVEANETVNLALTSPTGGATLGSPSTAVLTITDNDVAPAGLVAVYGFGEGTGPTTADASGNGNTGSIANATWTTSGKFGSALVFNGSNALVTIAHAPELNLTTAMTLMAWVKPSSATTNFRHVIWKDYLAYFFSSNSDTGAPGIGGNYGGGQAFLYAPSALTVDAWTHLAATFDGTTLRIFVNGTQVASEARSGVIATSTTNLKIGAGDGFEFFAGVLDEVRIYNVALTQAQIQADMNTPVGGATPGAGTIQFSAATYSVGENAGTATVTVTRTGGSSGAVSVTFATSTALQRHLGTTPRLVRSPLASPMAIPPARPLTSRSVTTPLLKRTRRSI